MRLGLVVRVLRLNEPTCVPDTADDPDFDRTVDCAPGYVIKSALCAPVCGSHGRVLAAVLLCNKQDPHKALTDGRFPRAELLEQAIRVAEASLCWTAKQSAPTRPSRLPAGHPVQGGS